MDAHELRKLQESRRRAQEEALGSLETQFSSHTASVRSKMAQDTHPEVVFEWRRAEFKKLGFKAATADWLAGTRIELRRMEKLIVNGCSQELAIDILEGTNFAGEDPVVQTEKLEYDE